MLVGVERGDTEQQADRLLERLLTYRVFPDAEGRMNRSLQDIGGRAAAGLAIHAGRRHAQGHAPGLQPGGGAAGRQTTVRLSGRSGHASAIGVVQTGEFGAHMQVTLTNDGPVTFWLQVADVGEDRRSLRRARAGS